MGFTRLSFLEEQRSILIERVDFPIGAELKCKELVGERIFFLLLLVNRDAPACKPTQLIWGGLSGTGW